MNVRFAIIGTGFGGLCAALKLREAGYRDIVLFERAPGIGGTWQANTYPGAACDAPSHLYSYSFAQNVEWSRRFAPGPEIRGYLEGVVRESGLGHHIRTGCAVVAARWHTGRWVLELADGTTETADVLIPAVGQLSVPAMPGWARDSEFAGEQFHTARWRHDLDLSGKRVAVVGTGASAIQVVPEIADRVDHLTVVQRTTPYVFFKPDREYDERIHRRYRALGALKTAARGMFWGGMEVLTYGFARYPWTLLALQLLHRWYLRTQVADPALRATLTPDYRVGCKRIMMSNDYYATLTRPDVDLVTAPVQRLTREGLRTAAGDHPVDVVIHATGFETGAFISSVRIHGRDGTSLDRAWSDRAGAYLGLTVPGFPNMFLVYGPNTNLGAGSIVHMLESQANYIVSAARHIAREGALEVTEHRYRDYLDEIAGRHPRTVWARCRNWYTDEHGHDTHNWPYSMSAYRRRTRRMNPRDYRTPPSPRIQRRETDAGQDRHP